MNRLLSRLSAVAAAVLFLAVVAVVRLNARGDISLESANGQPGLALSLHVNLGASPSAASMIAGLSGVANRFRIDTARTEQVTNSPEDSLPRSTCREC